MIMDEKEEKSEEVTTYNSNDGNTSEAPTLIDQANAAAERMEAANREKQRLIMAEEQLEAKKAFSGRALAGLTQSAPIAETDADYVKRFEAGEVNPLEDVK